MWLIFLQQVGWYTLNRLEELNLSVRIPAPSFVNVTIPEEITVHLGAPDEMAENVTLPLLIM